MSERTVSKNNWVLKTIISVILIIIGIFIFLISLFWFIANLALGLLKIQQSIPYLIMILFFVFVGIILVYLANELKFRYVLVTAMSFFLMVIMILMSFTTLDMAIKEKELTNEMEGIISNKLLDEYKDKFVLTDNDLLFYQLLIYSTIIISGIVGSTSIFIYFKGNLKKIKIS